MIVAFWRNWPRRVSGHTSETVLLGLGLLSWTALLTLLAMRSKARAT